jgi:ferredoxin
LPPTATPAIGIKIFIGDPASGAEKTTLTLDVTDAEKALIREDIDHCPTTAISIVS